MAARSVRRSFASPFVVTLAAALPAAACYVQPGPPPRSGGPPMGGAQTPGDRSNHAEPPRGATPSGPADTAQAGTPPTTIVANPPRPVPVAKQDLRWTVTRADGKCSASANATCPEPPAGQPRPSCNPSPPMAYTCPAQMSDNMITVVQFKGQSVCQIEHPPIKCPPNVMCNPPPPQKVDCPQ